MKRLLGLFMLIFVVLSTGCKDEKETPNIVPGGGDKVTFTVGVPEVLNYDDARSRITFQNESLGFTWDENDKIVVLGFDGSSCISQQEFALTDGKGTTTATFEGTLTKGASRYAVYYKSKNLSLNEKDGTATMTYDGQLQSVAASTAHLRDYLLLSANQLTQKDFASGAVKLSLQNSIMRFDVKAMQHDIGTIKSLEWINAFNTPDTHSMTLKLAPEAVSKGTLTTFLCFHPDSMTVAPGVTSGALFNAYNTYIVNATVTDGKTFAPGYCYHSTIQTEAADETLTDWKRVQTPDEIWVGTVPQADGNVAPTYNYPGFQKPVPVTGTDYWSYKSEDGSDVETIPDGFFQDDVELNAIRLPKHVTTIGDKAFAGCTSLEYFYYSPASDATLGDDLFEGISTQQTELVLGQRLLDQVVGKRWLDYKWNDTKGVDDYDNDLPIQPAKTQLWVRTDDDVIPPTISGFKTPTAKDEITGYWKYTTTEEITAVPDSLFSTAEGKEVIQEIFIPEGYTHIGNHAFEGCIGLTQLIMPATLTHIGNAALKGCNKLGTFTIPSGITTLGDEALACTLDELIVEAPAGLKVAANCFGPDKDLPTDLVLHESWYTAEEGRPEGKKWMGYTWNEIKFMNQEGGEIPSEPGDDEIWVTTTDNERPATVPTGFTLAEKLIMNTYWSFKTSDGEDITTLPANALANLPITSVILPETLTTIGTSAFEGCTVLPTIQLPAAVETIGEKAFYGCSALAKYSGKFASEDGRYLINKETLIAFAPAEATTFVTPEEITTVGAWALGGCNKLTQLTIGADITHIGNSAFQGCDALTNVIVKAGTSLKLGDKSFDAAKTPSVDLKLHYTWFTAEEGRPEGNKWMGYTWHSINYIDDNGNDYQFTQGNNEIWVTTTDNERPTTVPTGFTLSERLIMDTYWSFKTTDEKDVTTLPANAFKEMAITSVSLPSTLTTIGNSAFEGCTVLPTIQLPAAVETIGEKTFYGCSALATFSGKFASEDGKYLINKETLIAFAPAGAATIVTPSTVTAIGSYAIAGTNELTSLTISAPVSTVGTGAFAACPNLSTVTVLAKAGMKLATNSFGKNKNINADLILHKSWFTAEEGRPEGNVWMGYTWRSINYVDDNGNDYQTTQGKNEIWVTTTDNERPSTAPTGFELSDSLILNKYWSFKTADASDITLIPESAFAQLPLTSVILPSGITTISSSAFEGCTVLPQIELPASITTVAAKAFYGCSSLASFSGKFASEDGRYLQQGNTLIAFAPAEVTNITIPAGITTLGAYSLAGSKKLTDVTISVGVTTIGDAAFEGSTNLNKVTVKAQAGLQLGTNSFGTTKNIDTDLILHKSWFTASVGKPVGNDWMGYTWRSINFIDDNGNPYQTTQGNNEIWVTTTADARPANVPAGYTLSENRILEKYWSFKTSDGKDITSLAEATFANMPLVTVSLPATLETIGAKAFMGCDQLKQFTGKLATTDGRLLVTNQKVVAFAPAELTSYTLPATITAIGDYALHGSKLVDVTIPNTLETVGVQAFGNSPQLKEFIGNKVSQDGRCIIIDHKLVAYAPSGATSFTTSNDTWSIADQVFAGCNKLKYLTIQSWVYSIGNLTFDGCTGLEYVDIKADYHLKLGSNSFGTSNKVNAMLALDYRWLEAPVNRPVGNYWSGYTWLNISYPNRPTPTAPADNEIWVKITGTTPQTQLSNYTKATKVYKRDYWSYKATDEKAITEIANGLFENAKDITEIWLPSKIEKIGTTAFKNIPTLTDIKLPQALKSIGSNAFDGCTKLTILQLPDKVESIGSSAFSGCTDLHNLIIKSPYQAEFTTDTFTGLNTESVVLLLNKDWRTNGTQHPDLSTKSWLGHTWKAIGDAETGNVEIEDPGNSDNGFQ